MATATPYGRTQCLGITDINFRVGLQDGSAVMSNEDANPAGAFA